MKIEEYGLVGDLESSALVGSNGSVDWLCLPRFDSGAIFAALLGDKSNGHWIIESQEPSLRRVQRYRGETLILETEIFTERGSFRIIDFMPPRAKCPRLFRIVEGTGGTVAVRMELTFRLDYGRVIPWVRKKAGGASAVAGPDALQFYSDVKMQGEGLATAAGFDVQEGETFAFSLTWHPSHEPPPSKPDVRSGLIHTEAYWKDWCSRCDYDGEWRPQVMRSLITLKALTYAPTGGVIAAPTTSLPEQIGGYRNWDYRYCWLRDATFTLMAFLESGYTQEAAAWRDWLLRAVAGDPAKLQIMYGAAGERRLNEYEVDWLPGYEGSKPVRVGNAAADQVQLDVYGELIDALHQARCSGISPDKYAWSVQRVVLEFLEKAWPQPDKGIWEVRGPARNFVHSKVLAWAAFDRAIKTVEKFELDGPADRWRRIRSEIHRQVCERGYNRSAGAFTQSYETGKLDASTLLIPLVGFLPPTDERVLSTVRAIEKDLLIDGFVIRYHRDPSENVGELAAGEGAFLPCSFWLTDNYALQGRHEEAREMFERLLGICNPLGLLAEEYDPRAKRQLGNFPQAFSHVGLVNTAHNLSSSKSPVEKRRAN